MAESAPQEAGCCTMVRPSRRGLCPLLRMRTFLSGTRSLSVNPLDLLILRRPRERPSRRTQDGGERSSGGRRLHDDASFDTRALPAPQDEDIPVWNQKLIGQPPRSPHPEEAARAAVSTDAGWRRALLRRPQAARRCVRRDASPRGDAPQHEGIIAASAIPSGRIRKPCGSSPRGPSERPAFPTPPCAAAGPRRPGAASRGSGCGTPPARRRSR